MSLKDKEIPKIYMQIASLATMAIICCSLVIGFFSLNNNLNKVDSTVSGSLSLIYRELSEIDNNLNHIQRAIDRK